jgi:hypothetical protein
VRQLAQGSGHRRALLSEGSLLDAERLLVGRLGLEVSLLLDVDPAELSDGARDGGVVVRARRAACSSKSVSSGSRSSDSSRSSSAASSS